MRLLSLPTLYKFSIAFSMHWLFHPEILPHWLSDTKMFRYNHIFKMASVVIFHIPFLVSLPVYLFYYCQYDIHGGSSSAYVYMTVLWGCTGTLDGLVGYHTRLEIYPTLANLLPESCDPCFDWYQVQGDVGSDLPSYCQTTKVTLTEGSPERSGYIHMDKQVTQSILVMLFSMTGTEMAKVEGLWLVNRPKDLVPENPDDSPKVWLCSPVIVPSLNSKRSLWHHEMMSWGSALIFQWENHSACTSELLSFICTSAGIHTRTLSTLNASKPLFSSLTQFSHLWHSPPGILVHPHTRVLIYWHIPNKTQASIINKQGWWMQHID